MINLGELPIEDRIMHYLVRMNITKITPNMVKSNRTEFDMSVKKLAEKGYVIYEECTHELFKGEVENIRKTTIGEDYYNNKYSFK